MAKRTDKPKGSVTHRLLNDAVLGRITELTVKSRNGDVLVKVLANTERLRDWAKSYIKDVDLHG